MSPGTIYRPGEQPNQFGITDEAVERMAAYAHGQWSGWMRFLFSKSLLYGDGSVRIPSGLVERWMRQMNTEYDDLSEEEKEADRKEAEGFLYALAE